jgi:hypothetical protein
MATQEERLRDTGGFRGMSTEEARADAERYWLAWRAGRASVKPFTPGFPELAERYDPDAGGAPLGTMHGDAEPGVVDPSGGA